jgi:hypothetical protein
MPDTANEKRLYSIATVLLELTRRGRIDWSRGEDDLAFVTTRSETTIAIESLRADGGYPYQLTVYDRLGTPLDRLRTGQTTLFPGGEQTLASLYDAARASALDVAGALDDLLQDLGGELGGT